ncbi:patatin-like phospholipase family protein [Anaerobacillus isosaccharinicus]|uniref:Patatin family protein n=1 Tax=Anaerobacillus isosaccharinicus TaxID=1532552 RepID=A0A1S2L865_9BACI|nr:patatin family protein [Anaerobacillus isosaccharinicus]QOY35739.1 patatin family protein [Anaerobacillus isosaccharinicus]
MREYFVEKVGLVLEGGGMRGVYTGGVLEYFQDHQLYFPYVVGVSAGACNGASYVSRQKGRNHQVTIDLVNHPNYISYKNFIRKKELFGMDFIFDEIPNKLVPFDYKTFWEVPQKFYIGTTDCHTGAPTYFEKSECSREGLSTVLKASSSIPLLAPIVSYNGKDLLDGGVSEPIPINKSIKDGNTKHVVILTRPQGYRKEKQRFSWLLHKPYRRYPKLIETMKMRHAMYNSSLQFIEEEEKKENVFVLRPSIPLKVGRIERDKDKLTELYQLGYNDARKQYSKLNKWLEQ